MRNLATILTVLSVTFAFGYADEEAIPNPQCVCASLPGPPLMCRTKYLMLVRITAGIDDPLYNRRIYAFTLLNDISRQGPYSVSFNYIETPLLVNQCRQDLLIGSVYLLGGAVDVPNQRLFINKCSYVRGWPYLPGSTASDLELRRTIETCAQYPLEL